MIDFDKSIDRSQTASEKWSKDVLRKQFGRDDVLPFWVADMDFEAPPAVCDRLMQRAEDRVFGYEDRQTSLAAAIMDWYSRRHNWQFDEAALCFGRGTLNTIAMVLSLHTEEGDGVIIQPPVYFDFEQIIRDNNRTVVSNPLQIVDGRYEMDFADLERRAAEPRTKVLILCNPHNPVGRVWTRNDLQRLGQICIQHNVLVVSDEVHGDFVFKDHTFTPFASLAKEFAQQSFSCLSPAKTFNIPAVVENLVVISNPEYCSDFRRCAQRLSLNRINAFSVAAMEAAYGDSEEWLNQAIGYVHENVRYLRDELENRIPGVRLVEPEATFLAWLDFRRLGLGRERLERLLVQEARLAFKSGHSFGPEGDGFARMAIACPRSLLEEAVSRLEHAVKSIDK